ncbi:hypothetical protein M758_8G167800 [Ceratodon purpureus]|uniref:Uncharacterized protein n=1 Tax=Ceratodon purpureus TaxID=3225 RepID=A0A8T0H383_CERPU|nr:hypothetical protein KC19_8G173000 [Ceratodon purpureus]KAG0609223.1 hypothetical protein M758_8G167800 [Ceratodon purpureus]
MDVASCVKLRCDLTRWWDFVLGDNCVNHLMDIQNDGIRANRPMQLRDSRLILVTLWPCSCVVLCFVTK